MAGCRGWVLTGPRRDAGCGGRVSCGVEGAARVARSTHTRTPGEVSVSRDLLNKRPSVVLLIVLFFAFD